MRIPKIIPHCYKECIEGVELTFPLRLGWIRAIGGGPSFDAKNRPTRDSLSCILSGQTAEDVSFELGYFSFIFIFISFIFMFFGE